MIFPRRLALGLCLLVVPVSALAWPSCSGNWIQVPGGTSGPSSGIGSVTSEGGQSFQCQDNSNSPSSNSNSSSSAKSGSNSQASTGPISATGGNATGGKSKSTSSATGGTSSATGGDSGANANGTNTGTNSLAIQGGDTKVDARTIFVPSVVAETEGSFVGVGSIVPNVERRCGPLQRVIQVPVYGTQTGLFHKSQILLGYQDTLVPYLDVQGSEQLYKTFPLPNDEGTVIVGHQVTEYTAILGSSNLRQASIGASGGASGGNWAQAGLGGSAANQRLITTIELRYCEVGRITRPVPIVTPGPPVIVVPPVLPPVVPQPPQPVTPPHKHIKG